MRSIILVVFLLIYSPLIISAQTYADFKALAENGDADAQYNLGICYAKGRGVASNYCYATEWLKKAAKQALTDIGESW